MEGIWKYLSNICIRMLCRRVIVIKKGLLVFAGLIGLFVIVSTTSIVYNKLYYPALPIENVSKKEAVDRIKNSKEPMVHLTEENGYDWYVIKGGNQAVAAEAIKQMTAENGWVFEEQMGSAYIFAKPGEKLIVETEMWTSEYIIVQVPENVTD